VTPIERRYRRLLLAYPADYRRERGEEIVATLLDGADPARSRPTTGEAADVVLGGLRRRLGLDVVPGLATGARTAAPYALALAAGLSAFLLVCFEAAPVPGGWLRALRPAHAAGTVGVVAYACWLAALAAYALARPPVARAALGVATAATATVPLLAGVLGADRPPLWTVGTLTAFGFVALVGYRGPSTVERAGTVAGALAAALSASVLLVARLPVDAPRWHGYYQPAITISGLLVAVALATVLVRAYTDRPAAPWLWAALLLGLPGAWLGPWRLDPQDAPTARAVNAAGDADWYGFGAPHFGRLAQTLLGACAVLVAMGWLRARLAPTRRPLLNLGRAAEAATGWAAGLCAFLWVVDPAPYAVPGYAAWLLAAAAAPLPVRVRRYVTAGALAASLLFGARPAATGALLALGTVGLAGTFLPADPAGSRLLRRALAAACAGTAALAVGAYDNGWSLRGWTDPARTAVLCTTLALVPLALAAAVAVRALPSRSRPLWTVLAAAVAWTAALALPHLSSWGPVLLLAGAAALAAGPLVLLRRVPG